jgi:mono/diheme cytochrome c family protein
VTEKDQQERERLEQRTESDRRFYVRLLGFLAALVVLGLAAIVYVLATNDLTSVEGEAQPPATEVSTATETQAAQPTVTQAAPPTASSGKDLFASTCGGCHTLASAGTTGTVGPDLDALKPDQGTVQAAIQSGPGAMPSNLLTGAQAQQVAAFVAASAGR